LAQTIHSKIISQSSSHANTILFQICWYIKKQNKLACKYPHNSSLFFPRPVSPSTHQFNLVGTSKNKTHWHLNIHSKIISHLSSSYRVNPMLLIISISWH